VALPDTVVNNARTVREAAGTRIDQAFVGSCANGTIGDLEAVASVVRGRRVARGVTLVVTPGSQAIYREAGRRGLIGIRSDAGAVGTRGRWGACAGLHFVVLTAGQRCITASTRNFKGRMGSPKAEIYMASPATVAASALEGVIADPRRYLEGARA